ncbi:sigma-E processing peptidase SpoIIGA [Paenibacillus abyssi]|uniref:Sporulation sigma-E factor-processing peptidase n=1 Tax=Paenibacillus abyssi TaxID=1340531 RepID=A0A917D415_9BACL|nr:sigma-E processing peptidase SpoIIGA [Paenibacillus abyssi]GGG10199.1 sporulation sigma-E factor-processing peptidase [Paenibacillus abyssi]
MYVDLVFLLNLFIDAAVLLMTAWVRGIRPRWIRIGCAAGIGACYVVMMFVPQLSFLFAFGIKFALSLLMVWAAFGFVGLQHFLRNIAAFYGVNFAAAGGVFGLYFLLQSSTSFWNGIWFMRTGGQGTAFNLSLLFLGIAFAAALLIYRLVLSGRKQREQLLSHVAEVIVQIGEREQRCKGLIDTGNHLYDPLTRTPVMIMEAALWAGDLPPSWMEKIKEAQVDRLLAGIGEETCVWQDRLRLVPYRGVNRGTQFMLALKPDRVRIEQEGRVFESHKVLIGLDGGKLVSDGAYQAIIHPSLIQNSNETLTQVGLQTGRELPK